MRMRAVVLAPPEQRPFAQRPFAQRLFAQRPFAPLLSPQQTHPCHRTRVTGRHARGGEEGGGRRAGGPVERRMEQ
eukprot:1391317-Rhodomonas_salina.1